MEIMYILIIFYLLYLLVNVDRQGVSRLKNLRRNGRALKGSRVLSLHSWIQKRVGLLNGLSLSQGEGLWFENTKKIHTVGMVFPIDVIYMDKNGEILEIQRAVPPGIKGIRAPVETRKVLELGAGQARISLLKCGDRLEVY